MIGSEYETEAILRQRERDHAEACRYADDLIGRHLWGLLLKLDGNLAVAVWNALYDHRRQNLENGEEVA